MNMMELHGDNRVHVSIGRKAPRTPENNSAVTENLVSNNE